MNWKFKRNKIEEERIAKAEAAERKANLAAGKPAVATQEVVERMVARTGKPYFDTMDELERIYAEVVKEAGGVSDYSKGPSPVPILTQWQPYIQEYPTPNFEYDYVIGEGGALTKVVRMPGNPGPRGFEKTFERQEIVGLFEEPKPAGVTLEELFAQDEAEDGETL